MDRLDDLLLEWEEQKDRGTPVGPTELCPNDPDMAAQLADRIRYIEACNRLLDLSSLEPPGDPLPSRVGKYEIRRVIKSGGMGVVYEGWDPGLRRVVAIKMIHPRHLLVAGEKSAARFAREGQVLARLDHPNVVPVHEIGVHADSPYLVMKYVPGGSLADHREQLTGAGPSLIVPLMEKVARAVHYAHTEGVLHRDLKPGNVLVADSGEPMVADFGLAKLREPDEVTEPVGDADTRPEAAAITTTGVAPGTPAYMAPEQADPRVGAVGPPTDVWALGVILCELLTGSRPTATPDAKDRVPKPLDAVVSRCLEPDPARRYQTAGELADALEDLRRPSRRRVLRRAVAVGCGLLGIGVPLGVYASDSYRRFLWRTRGLVRRLKNGESVELIHPGGPAPDYYLHTTEGVTDTGFRDSGWAVSSTALTLIELVPELPNECTVKAELRYDNNKFRVNPMGNGLVFGHARVREGDQWWHFVSRVAFDDWAAKKGWVQIASVWPVGRPDTAGGPSTISPPNAVKYYEASATRPPPFRTIELTITPEGTTGWWHGEERIPLAPLSRAVVENQIGRLRERHSPEQVEQVRAGYGFRIGLIVSGGQISVRSLRVGPREM